MRKWLIRIVDKNAQSQIGYALCRWWWARRLGCVFRTIVLGGHSLVSGGLYALVEAAWARGEDLARHVEPLQ